MWGREGVRERGKLWNARKGESGRGGKAIRRERGIKKRWKE